MQREEHHEKSESEFTPEEAYLNRIVLQAKLADWQSQECKINTHTKFRLYEPTESDDSPNAATDNNIRQFYKNYLDRGLLYLSMDPQFAVNPVFMSALEEVDALDQAVRPQLEKPYFTEKTIHHEDGESNQETTLSINKTKNLYERTISDYTLLLALLKLDQIKRGTDPSKIGLSEDNARNTIKLLEHKDLSSLEGLAKAAVLNYLPPGESIPEVAPYYTTISKQRGFDKFIKSLYEKILSKNYYEGKYSTEDLNEEREEIYQTLSYLPDLFRSVGGGSVRQTVTA